MKSLMKLQPLWIALSVAMLALSQARAQAGTAKPQVSLPWPTDGDVFTGETTFRVRADVIPGSHAIAFVQFFEDTNLWATVTNPPYATMWWPTYRPNHAYSWWFDLTAVAVDTAGFRS